MDTTVWPKDKDVELDAFYGGRPDGSAKWEIANLVYIMVPWKIYLAGTKIELKRGIRVHKKVADTLKIILGEIWDYCGKSQATIEKYNLHQIGGAYYFRARRGSNRVSNHGRGIAVDIDPLSNQMKRGNKGDMAAFVILIFQRHGCRWGGEYGDPMHFEFVQSNLSDSIREAWKVNPIVPKVVKVVEVPKETTKWTIPEKAIEIAKFEESLMLKAYNDRGSPAIAYGHTSKIGFPVVTMDMTCTKEQAEIWLRQDATKVLGQIMPLIKVHANPNQLGAFFLFVYNVGITNFTSSTLLRKFNAGDLEGAAAEFQKWNKSTNPVTHVKEVLKGLTRRRAKEQELFETKYV